MIVCPNCNHQNPEGAQACEACFTPLPETTSCPNCGASVQTDASFCGQCGASLEPSATPAVTSEEGNASPSVGTPAASDPDLDALESLESSEAEVEPKAAESGAQASVSAATQLQQFAAKLLHVQSDTAMELPSHLSVIHIGKPNDRVPPDIDVSGFAHSEIVSRVHANIRVEGDAYYIEDVGSSNGTYINNLPLPKGNRHRLRPGDRIALGKGDLVTLLFQLS